MEKFKEFVACYLDAWHKYHSFSGRATRKDYWGFFLINLLIAFVIGIVEAIIGMDDGFISSLYSLAVICPNLALGARRLHDVGKSGWWQIAIVVPLLCFYPLYLMWIKKGNDEINKYGAPIAAEQPLYGAYSVPVENEFSSYEMCPAPAPKPEQPVQPAEEKPELPQLKKKCTSCGAEIKIAAKFCSECGAQQ